MGSGCRGAITRSSRASNRSTRSGANRDVMAEVLETMASETEVLLASDEPAHRDWRAFYESTGAERERHVHVAQSRFHDIVPANELGIRSVWINRLGERAEPAPTRELPDLRGLADVLDELVPAVPTSIRS
jgi:2-haloacid dehalogenase